MSNKKVFTVKLENGEELELAVVRTSPQTQVEAQLIYNKMWRKAEETGSILRRNLDKIAEDRGLWNKETEEKVKLIEEKILEAEKKLRGGANSFSTLEDAKKEALNIRKLRGERAELIRPKLELDSYTAESFADMARTNWIIANTVVYNSDGKVYFKDYNDFITQSNSQIALNAATAYFEFAISDNREDTYEDVFLKKYKFINEDGHLIDSEGRLISEDNKLVNKEGRYITAEGKLCDVNGNLVDDKGNFLVEWKDWSNEVEGV